ncbi:MAG: transcription antitermination factor NusB [Gammaproteobacteria bacterium]
MPLKVVITEAVQLARQFGAQDGHRYVNALLDRVAPVLRRSG